MKLLYYFFSIFAVVCLLAFSKQTKEQKGNLKIEFNHYVMNDLLKLDSVEYKNELNQSFTISKFKYYVGKIQLKKSNKIIYSSNEHYLIDHDDIFSKSINLFDVSIGEYDEITFLLGVDSLTNCSGAQSGSLDPINGMFWAWNTGYIFLKLEGNAKSCNTSSKTFEYHIGGYKQPFNAIRKITLKLPQPLLVNKTLKQNIQIKVSIDEIFKNPISIDFSKTPTIIDHTKAKLIADNYADIFSVLKVSDEQ